MKKQKIKTKHGTIIAEPYNPPKQTKAKKPKEQPQASSAERIERELNALDRLYRIANREMILSVNQYKRKRKQILERLLVGAGPQ